MSFIKRMRRQKAVYWARTEPDQYGQFGFVAPVEIACRWEDKIGEFRNDVGEKLASKATVYVDREMRVGDKLKKGAMESDAASDPSSDPDAYEVMAFEVLPNLRNTENLLTAYL